MRGDNKNLMVCDTEFPAERQAELTTRKPYSICYEAGSGIIRATARGFWTIEETDAYFLRLAAYIDAVRDRFGKVRMISDRRGPPIQSSEVAMLMHVTIKDLYLPEDRLAVVVDTSLMKMQARRLFVTDGMKAFLSYDAACTWLSACP